MVRAALTVVVVVSGEGCVLICVCTYIWECAVISCVSACHGLQEGLLFWELSWWIQEEIHSISLNAGKPWVFCLNVCSVLFSWEYLCRLEIRLAWHGFNNNARPCFPLGEREWKMVNSYSPVLLISLLGKRCVQHNRGCGRKAQAGVQTDTEPQTYLEKCELRKKSGECFIVETDTTANFSACSDFDVISKKWWNAYSSLNLYKRCDVSFYPLMSTMDFYNFLYSF